MLCARQEDLESVGSDNGNVVNCLQDLAHDIKSEKCKQQVSVSEKCKQHIASEKPKQHIASEKCKQHVASEKCKPQ
eukprot:scaffold283529_cov20-Tisochrysis_lutea.AAC.1